MSGAAARRRRSVLSVPASDRHKVEKALNSTADQVVLDLEDAVEPGSKDQARRLVLGLLTELSRSEASRVTVRVNAPRTPWCHLDIAALAGSPVLPDSLVVPKVEGPADLAFVDRLLDGVLAGGGRGRDLGVQALVETATGLAAAREIAGSSQRLEALVVGYADLAASLGVTAAPQKQPELWVPVQQAVLVAARSAGVQVVDGPYLGVDTGSGFTAAVDRARDLGFDGKWAIHPRQVDLLNHAFTPTQDEVAWARAVLAALEVAARDAGSGAVQLRGQMVDEAVGVAARRVLARAGERA